MKVVAFSWPIKARMLVSVASWLFLMLSHGASLVRGEVMITEVAAKSSRSTCLGRDWVEIHNPNATAPVDLFTGGYVLHDDKGVTNEQAFFFPPGTVLQPGEYRIWCTKSEPREESPQFGIGRQDTVTLAAVSSASSSVEVGTGRAMGLYQVVSSTGPLPYITVMDGFDVSYAWDSTTGRYEYTSTPTPGAGNVLTPVGSTAEQIAALKTQLTAQNDLGAVFFNMDDRGLSVPDGMDTVLDLRLVMVEDDYSYLLQNASYEVYRPFQSATVTVRDKPDQVVLALNSPGRVRPKGQFSLYMPLCIGTSNFPFQLDFSDTNSSQTLFGAERVYLRSHFGDNSYARDWAYYRMAARFGLPHLRARKVRFFINDQVHGFYTLLEAPDQAYVFQRNFPLYDFTNYALYKVKTTALGCGQYTDQELETAQARLVSSSEATPPYAFERGEHKSKVVPAAAQGPTALTECFFSFFGSVAANDADSALAYLRYNQNCADMLVEEGLVDRDLGSSSWDSPMKKFIDAGAFDYPQAVDVTSAPALAEPLDPYEWMDTDSTLKMIAFYAVALIMDSPMGNGNNFYWLQTGEEANGGSGGWKIFPYDFNSPSTIICGATCDTKMVYWSIVQPTCSHLTKNPVVGPLLSDATLQETYLKYVEEFLETVYANATFVQELQDHIQAQDVDVRNDSWSAGGIFYDAEQSPEASQWNDSIPNFPFLPTMKARAASVREQLDAIADGTFPRGAHGVGLGGDYEMWESCPDWRLTEAPGSECPQSCRYEGCHTPGWIVESSCDVASKTCVRGNFDPLCNGVPDGGRYEGMEEGPGIVCFNVNGFDTKMESCPPFVEEEEDDEIVEEGMSHAGVLRPALYTAVLVLVILSLLS